MASAIYMAGRKKYARPQAIIWSDGYTQDTGLYVPTGVEYEDFIILSDHNRSEIKVGSDRIENRRRMINGTMRSYHVADKEKYAFSWERLPSRAFSEDPMFSASGTTIVSSSGQYTADLGAGGKDIVEWYENHSGPFWMLLSYDINNQYGQVNKYTKVVHVYFSNFNHVVEKRGVTDWWNIEVELEEV